MAMALKHLYYFETLVPRRPGGKPHAARLVSDEFHFSGFSDRCKVACHCHGNALFLPASPSATAASSPVKALTFRAFSGVAIMPSL
jgi:hypothetical protein